MWENWGGLEGMSKPILKQAFLCGELVDVDYSTRRPRPRSKGTFEWLTALANESEHVLQVPQCQCLVLRILQKTVPDVRVN